MHNAGRSQMAAALLDTQASGSYWVLDDPAGKDVAAVHPIRDEIERRVRVLIRELFPTDVATS